MHVDLCMSNPRWWTFYNNRNERTVRIYSEPKQNSTKIGSLYFICFTLLFLELNDFIKFETKPQLNGDKKWFLQMWAHCCFDFAPSRSPYGSDTKGHFMRHKLRWWINQRGRKLAWSSEEVPVDQMPLYYWILWVLPLLWNPLCWARLWDEGLSGLDWKKRGIGLSTAVIVVVWLLLLNWKDK